MDEVAMEADFINLTTDNLAEEHLCCIIRSKKAHPGVKARARLIRHMAKA